MVSGYHLDVNLPDLADGLAVGKRKRKINANSQGFGLDKSVSGDRADGIID